MYAVFHFPPDSQLRAQEVLADDLVSRQSLATRDARALGMDRDGLLVVLEGREEAADRFAALAGEAARRLTGEEAERVHRLLKEQEEEAAEGMGFLFGG